MSSYLLRKVSPSEDAVTGLFVDLLRAWPTRRTLLALLGTVLPHPQAVWELPEFDDVDITPWPAWKSGEPDVVLSLKREHTVVAHVVIEAKLGAKKSSVDAGPIGEDEDTWDQLAKYQREAAGLWPSAPVVVIYLTHSVVAPIEELAASLAKMRPSPAQGLVPSLAWSTWRDVDASLRGLAATTQDRALATYALGLAEVLRAAGMHRFTGHWNRAVLCPRRPACIFWKTRGYQWGRATVVGRPTKAIYRRSL